MDGTLEEKTGTRTNDDHQPGEADEEGKGDGSGTDEVIQRVEWNMAEREKERERVDPTLGRFRTVIHPLDGAVLRPSVGEGPRGLPVDLFGELFDGADEQIDRTKL